MQVDYHQKVVTDTGFELEELLFFRSQGRALHEELGCSLLKVSSISREPMTFNVLEGSGCANCPCLSVEEALENGTEKHAGKHQCTHKSM